MSFMLYYLCSILVIYRFVSRHIIVYMFTHYRGGINLVPLQSVTYMFDNWLPGLQLKFIKIYSCWGVRFMLGIVDLH
jgi:hypothetical protein